MAKVGKTSIDVKVKISVGLKLDELTEQELNQVVALKPKLAQMGVLDQAPLLGEFADACIDALVQFRENQYGRDI